MDTRRQYRVRRREEKQLCELEHVLSCIGLLRKQISFFFSNNLRIIQDMMRVRMETLNEFIGDGTYRINEQQRDDIIDFCVWCQV